MKPLKNVSLPFIGFLQALGIFLYCSLVGMIFLAGNAYMLNPGPFLAPLLMLTLLVSSVLICALLTFGYAFILFWEKKEIKESIILVGYTAAWLALIALLILITILVIK